MSEFPSASVLHKLAEKRVGGVGGVGADLFREAMSAACGNGEGKFSARPSRWVEVLLASEAHVRETGRKPRENTRNIASLPASEQRLAEWARRQREQWERLTPYQQARLEVSPAFSLDRQQERWDAQVRACFQFVARHNGRLPALSRVNPVEYGLARWWRLQVTLMSASRLPHRRAASIEELLATARLVSSRNRRGAGVGGQFRSRATSGR